jgi:hypothetical protein
MKKAQNTDLPNFHKKVETDTIVTITYKGSSMTFKNCKWNEMSLWEMCEFLILGDLQYFWDSQLDLTKSEVYNRKEKQLMNECEIKFH